MAETKDKGEQVSVRLDLDLRAAIGRIRALAVRLVQREPRK